MVRNQKDGSGPTTPETSDTATYRVNSNGDGFLFRSVTHTAEWRAWVDGVEQPVLRANYLFQAVPVPAGPHTVEFKYDSRPFYLGLQITAAAGLIAGLVVLIAAGDALWRRSRRRPSQVSGPTD
jgi:uncharacterized membrane protein YfhO